MPSEWSELVRRFYAEAAQFTAAALARRRVAEYGGAYDPVWRTFEARRGRFQKAVAEIVTFTPTRKGEARVRENLAGRMMTLCQRLDETWLEFEAEKIIPPLTMPEG